MILAWIRFHVYNFLAPHFLAALDECNKRNLSQYFNEQNERNKQYNAYLLESQDFMRSMARDQEMNKDNHGELMSRFDRLISVIENK